MTLGTYLSQGQWQECEILGECPGGASLICREVDKQLPGVFLANRGDVRIVVGWLYVPPENTPRPRLP